MKDIGGRRRAAATMDDEGPMGLKRGPDGTLRVLTRRDALKASALTVAAVGGAPWALAACGGSDATTGASTGAPSGTPRRGGTLTFAVDGLTGNLDPGIYTTFGGIMGTNLVSRCLTFTDYHTFGQQDPAPGLAESWETARGGRIYRFNLRAGVRFHDGTTLTANDCVRSFRRLMDERDPSRPPGTYAIAEIGGSNIRDVRAVEDLVFEVVLGQPDVVLPVRFGRYNSAILSAAAIDRYGARIGTRMITAGPFEVVSYTPNQGMRFRAFEDYYEGRPYLDEVVLQIIPDSATLTGSVRNGSVQATAFVAFSDLPTFERAPGFVVENPDPIITLFLGQNLRSRPLSDLRIRQAINYAVDRDAINQSVLFGYAKGTPAGYIPPPVLGHDDSLAEYSRQDLERARALLADAGDPGPIRFHTSNFGIWPRVGQIVVQNLQAAGFTIRADYVDPATDSARIFAAEEHDLFLNNRGGALADPDSWAATNEAASDINRTWWGVPEVLPQVQARIDDLIGHARREADPDAREKVYREYQRILMEEVMGIVVLAYQSQVTVRSEKVHDLDARSLNAWALYAQRAWLS